MQHPISGSFSAYAGKFISPLMGYITGWNYWFFWIFAMMADIAAVGTYMKEWFPDVPTWIWPLISLVTLTLVNLISVKAFGEFEFRLIQLFF